MKFKNIGIVLMAIALLTIPIYQAKAQGARGVAQAGLEFIGSALRVPLILGLVILQIVFNLVKTLVNEYCWGYVDLVYYGFIRPLILDLIMILGFLAMIVLDIIGIIPIVSIPMGALSNVILTFVLFPVAFSMLGYYPESYLDPITQGMNIFKNGGMGIIYLIVFLFIHLLELIYFIMMVIPIINIAGAIGQILVIIVLGGILVIAMPIVALLMNLFYILPTICNYTPIINICRACFI
jgi:hypothetical protein